MPLFTLGDVALLVIVIGGGVAIVLLWYHTRR